MKKRFLSMKTDKTEKKPVGRRITILALILAITLAMIPLASCGSQGDGSSGSDTITVTDHADRQVEVPANIERIAVCDIFPLPSVLSVFFNSADKIVGMPEASMTAAKNGLLGQLYPEILDAETGFVDGEDVNMEELAKLEPDVVFYSSTSTELGDQLTEAGFAAVAVSADKWDFNCIETLNNWIDLLSQMFPENDKTEIVKEKSGEIYDMVQERVKDIPENEKANAFFVFQYSDTTLVTAGKQAFGQWWADATGMNNVASEVEGNKMAPVNMEQVYDWNPDIIFVTNFNTYFPDDLYNNTVEGYDWSPVQAVKDRKVYKMPLGMYRSYTPGVDCPVTLLWMAKTVYPEKFEDIDVIEEAVNYYKDVFGIELTDEQARSIFEPSQSAGGGFAYQ